MSSMANSRMTTLLYSRDAASSRIERSIDEEDGDVVRENIRDSFVHIGPRPSVMLPPHYHHQPIPPTVMDIPSHLMLPQLPAAPLTSMLPAPKPLMINPTTPHSFDKELEDADAKATQIGYMGPHILKAFSTHSNTQYRTEIENTDGQGIEYYSDNGPSTPHHWDSNVIIRCQLNQLENARTKHSESSAFVEHKIVNKPKAKSKITRKANQKHFCPQCEMGFTRRSSLKSHLLIHSGERPFKCPQCPKTFPRRWSMRRHQTNRHLKRQKNAKNAITKKGIKK
mmetsp:Transcript_15902/g.39211  ORF Transcript_15902/g.39211 Transcript_15902/m.39211 type:complete len:282 (+) Transcript_15902:217-1062(+)